MDTRGAWDNMNSENCARFSKTMVTVIQVKELFPAYYNDIRSVCTWGAMNVAAIAFTGSTANAR